MGVEFGQIAVLIIVFPLLSMIKGKLFVTISKFSNWTLVIAGVFLLVFQLNGFFIDDIHHDQNHLESEQHMKVDENKHEHDHEHGHDHSHSH